MSHNLKDNMFLWNVYSIAQTEGYNPEHIVSMFRSLSSTDFVCGQPTVENRRDIPDGVWQGVCTMYDSHTQSPYSYSRARPDPVYEHNTSSMVFMRSKVTGQLIRSQMIREHIPTTRRLYQYLNWTLRINKVAQTTVVVEGRNGCKLMMVNVELHNRRGHELYALCCPNDVTTPNAQPWLLVSLFTATELTKLLGVDAQCLPRGVRAVAPQFGQYRMDWGYGTMKTLKAQILEIDDRQNMMRYSRLRCIRTGNGKKSKNKQSGERELIVGLSHFYDAVRWALYDEDAHLVPIVSRTKEKVEDFSVDYMLPVRVRGDWVGVVYRDGQCKMALLDRYDITNKALLCNPAFNVEDMKWFRSSYNRLKVVPDRPPPSPQSSAMTESTMRTADTPPPSVSDEPLVPSLCTTQYPVIQPVDVSAEELMEFMEQLKRNVMYNKSYFAQFLRPNAR